MNFEEHSNNNVKKNSQGQTKRLFLAVFPEKNILDNICLIKKILKDENLRWISKKRLHITVYFIGNFFEKQLPLLLIFLSNFFSSTKMFYLDFDKISYAPKKDIRPNMVWAEFKVASEYQKIFYGIHTLLKKINIDNKQILDKELIPHITLARSKKGFSRKILDQLKQPKVSSLLVDSIFLVESQITIAGSSYSIIKEFKLI